MSRSFLLWFLAPFDSGRCLAAKVLRVIEPGSGQVALKEPAQVIASGMEAQLNGAPVNGNFHFRGTAERQGSIGTAGIFLGRHLAELLPSLADVGDFVERYMVKAPVGVLDHQHRKADQCFTRIGYRQCEAVNSGQDKRPKHSLIQELL
jgi:hypothetical protein